MVSFFGLKLGSDKKKSQEKHKPPSRSILHLNDQPLESPRDFPRELQRPTSNFSRPGRPDTSSSNHAPTQWHAPYMGGAGATSSMVDLAAPRAPGLGSSRMHASDLNLNTRFNGSSTSLAMPGPIGGANRPGTPTRPGTATSKRTEWENPFHVHFGGADSAGNTPISPVAGKNSLEQFEFGVNANHTRDTSNPGMNGYPSPPPSILSAELPFSPKNSDGRPSSSRRNAPSALRNVETTGPRALPSPAASVLRTSEDIWDVPVIRNVQAKRDTLTFHTPRRQSFSMEVDDVDKAKGKPMTEGLAGNFTAFDFGDNVRRGSVSKNSLEAPSIDSISPTGGVGPRPFGTARTASPLRSMQSTPSLSNESRSTRERNTSDAASALSSTQESIGRRSPIPPSKPAHPIQLQQSDVFHMQPPAPAPTGPIPAPPKGTSIRTNNAAPAAAYGVHPGYMSRPLDPPPRGFRARVDSDSRRRPPNGLRVPPPLVDRSGGGSISSLSSSVGNPRSPYGPPPDEGSYMRDDRSPRPPPEDRAQSPFVRPAMEGNFPVQKGLPRGRRPPALEGLSPEPGGLGPRRQQRQRPMYPPPKAEPSPTNDSKPKNSTEDHGYSLPNWSDFDRSSPHRSAMPAPLSPFRTDSQLPDTPPADDSSRRSMYTSSPISPKPPSLPSPSFFSLQSSISNSSENLARSFDVAPESTTTTTTNTNANNEYGNYPRNRPLISPVMVEFSRSLSPGNTTRVEAKKAPPRPSPITLAPSNDTERDRSRTRTPAVDQFSPGFI